MSFESKKDVYGESLSHGVSIFVSACKYTVDGAFEKGDITTTSSISDTFTGALGVSGGEATFFTTSNPYLKIEDEIIKISVNSDSEVEVLERGAFGTTATSHDAGSARVIHGGEADGSCLGYPRRPDGGGCSTADSFDRDAERELLFIADQSFDGQIYFNGLLPRGLNHSPTEIKPGEGIAKNAGYSVTITDNTDDDVYTVPYPERRTSNSTLFKKLLARTGGYLQNRRAEVYTGFKNNGNFSKAECVKREYVIDSVSLNNSTFSMSLKDPLMLAEEAKAKMPAVSSGKLLNAIDDTSTQITMKDFLVGEYGNNGDIVTVKIDSELIDCTVNDSPTGVLDITTRAVGGSEKKDHSINASVQFVIVLGRPDNLGNPTEWNPISAIIDFHQLYTNIPSRFYGDYTDAIASTPNANGTAYIHKPDSVKRYAENIIKSWGQSNIAMYFNERTQLIDIKVSGDFEQQPITLDYSVDIKQDSLSIKPDYKGQITRSTIGFAPFDASKKVDDENASIVFESINALTELTGTLEAQSDKVVYTQFLTNSDTDVQIAVAGAARKANLNVKVPEIFSFKIDYSKYGTIPGGKIEEGEIINVTTDKVVNDDGSPRSSNLQILSLKDNPKEATYTLKAITYQDIITAEDFDFVIDEDKENYDLSTEFAPSEAGEYTVFIQSGVTIGATSTAVKAFTTGAQNAGVSLKLIIRGSILGAGGKGGNGGDAFATNYNDTPIRIVAPSQPGFNGGDALNLTCDTEIDISQGVIYAGGGGSPSVKSVADSTNPTPYVRGGDGGSGGQGYIGGEKGRGGTATVEGIPIAVDTGSDGVSGSRSAPGSLGGISGGAWGEDGDTDPTRASAGKSGYSIRSNENSVTIIGDNDLTIKGRRD